VVPPFGPTGAAAPGGNCPRCWTTTVPAPSARTIPPRGDRESWRNRPRRPAHAEPPSAD